MIKGITVTLYEATPTGTDDFNRPILTETPVQIPNVLVSPLTDTEVLETLNLTGRRAVYQMAIPKGDQHEWENRKVSFFGETFRVIGHPTQGIEANIPLAWNKKVKVETYGGSENRA